MAGESGIDITLVTIPPACATLSEEHVSWLLEKRHAMEQLSECIGKRTGPAAALHTYRPLSTLEIRKVTRRLAKPVRDWSFTFMGHVFTATVEFIFDGASIPFFLWWWVSPFTAWVIEASCGHDLLYRYFNLPSFHVSVEGARRPLTRREMDRMFLAALVYTIDNSGRSRLWRANRKRRARIMYFAVRRFGWMFIGDGDGSNAPSIASTAVRCYLLRILATLFGAGFVYMIIKKTNTKKRVGIADEQEGDKA